MLADLRRFEEALERESQLVSLHVHVGELLNSSRWSDPGFLLDDLKNDGVSSTEIAEHSYRAFVVAAYGALERFMEDLLESAARGYAQLASTYGELPPAVRANHEYQSLEVARRVHLGQYPVALEVRRLVEGLQLTMNTPGPFVLNESVFSEHRSNFKHAIVVETFKRLALDVARVANDKTFLAVSDQHFPSQLPTAVVDDLAVRRNEIAHGASFQLLSPELMKSYVEVMKAYGRSVVEHVTDGLVRYSLSLGSTALGQPDAVFRHSILGWHSIAANVDAGAVVALLPPKGLARPSRVLSVRSNGVTAPRCLAGQPGSLLVDQRVTAGMRVFVLTGNATSLL